MRDCGTGGLLDAVLRGGGRRAHSGRALLRIFRNRARCSTSSPRPKPGTFYLTDFLLRHFERLVMRGLGLDRHPELFSSYFGNYRKLVYLAQAPEPAAIEEGRAIARAHGPGIRVSQDRLRHARDQPQARGRGSREPCVATRRSCMGVVDHHFLARHSAPRSSSSAAARRRRCNCRSAFKRRSIAPRCAPARAAPMRISPIGSAARRSRAAMILQAEAAAEAARLEALGSPTRIWSG